MQHWDSDEHLLGALRTALTEADAVPPAFLEAGRAAFAWRTVDVDLLLLTSYDSILDAGLAGRARAVLTARQLVFDADDVSLQVEVTTAGIAGQLMPPGAAVVVLLTPAGPVEETVTDEFGSFLLGPPPPGPMRLRCTVDGTTVQTDWICV
ncbi:hypothetical protein [Umezawaea sp. Da 62-37]|uniref:hypothetical protein n=1 Tax=Umezawaea sp. Da 62-37 TaxID=3075927 RepID=UPI0028F6D269|nr:hypothetical protein [Umezawaea sp. Da 62-37]WNV89388.1 hypothetical protein RM788_14110 [Umezawaea sp. Da 62-37]